MGGSSESYFSQETVESLRAEAAGRLERGQIDADVNSMLQRELAEVNDRDIEGINRKLEQIENLLEGQVGGFDRLLFGGSVAKRTYVDGLSDVDSLVVLNDESFTSKTPEEVREQLRNLLMRRLPMGEIVEVLAGFAITIVYRDGTEIQLLPVIQMDEEISISSRDGMDWIAIDPRRFAEELTDSNKRQGGAVVPVIKLAKVLFDSTLGDAGPHSYHIEALAIAAFEDYSGARTPKSMLLHLIGSASQDVLRPINEITGQSLHVDEYLGDRGSSARRALSRRLEELSNTMISGSVSDWRALFE